MYLEAFTVIKIESLASDLEISPKDVTTLLEQEIKAKKINFLINKVGGYVERSDKQKTHLNLLDKATAILTKNNESSMKKMLGHQYKHMETARGLGGGGMNMEEIEGDMDFDLDSGRTTGLVQAMKGYYGISGNGRPSRKR
jgi:hypothetical protein